MAQNTVQYQRGLSLPEFFDEYGLQERCEDLVRAWRWPEGFILHEPHVTGGGVASAKHPSFMAVNTVLANIKTSLAGTYHAFGFQKYAHRYLGQVQYLVNRRFALRAILQRLARAASRASPCRLRLVRAAKSSC